MSKQQEDKDKNEFATIRPLLNYLGIGEDIVAKDERPDFTFMYNDHKVGLELVTICPSSKYEAKGRSLASINSIKRQKAIEGYQQFLIEMNENIVIGVKFNRNAFWNHEPLHIFVKKVIKEVEDLKSLQKEKFLTGERISNNCNTEISYIEFVELISINTEKPLVLSLSGQVMQRITQADFDQLVTKKYKSLKAYKQLKKNCDIEEYWLAVAENIKEPFEFWDAPYNISEDSEYERIFLIGYEGVREMPLTNKMR